MLQRPQDKGRSAPVTMGTFVSTIGLLGLLFGLRWCLAHARIAAVRAGRRRGGGRGHFLRRTDRAVGDRVLLAVCAAGTAVTLLFDVRWACWVAVAIAGPAALVVGRVIEDQRVRRFEAEAMAVLEALRGFLRSGALSPPAALARIGNVGRGDGADRLRSRLATLDDGESFERALRRFARKLGASPVAATFAAIAEAAQSGLPLLPLLDRALPELRTQALADEKLRAVRGRAVAQAAVASLVPWGLAALVAASSPEPLLSDGPVLVARMLAVALEIAGIALAWRLTCFR